MRPSGACVTICFSKSEPIKPAVCVPSVSTIPGFSAFTRIFRGPSSRASTPVIASTAPLVPVYTELFGGVTSVTAEPMLMMLPPSFRCFTASLVVSSSPSTFTLKIL